MGGLPIVPYSTYIERSTAQEMGKLAEEFGPNFIMEVGDNFYLTGVTDVNDPRFQASLILKILTDWTYILKHLLKCS